MAKVKINDTIKVHYTGKLSNGQVFDTSDNREPLQFKVGAGNMIKGFELAVLDMEYEETKTVNIPCDEAYGQVQPQLIQVVSKTQLPDGMEVAVGQQLVSNYNEHEIVVLVKDVTAETIIVDANHPLAGQDLTFDLKVVDIQEG